MDYVGNKIGYYKIYADGGHFAVLCTLLLTESLKGGYMARCRSPKFALTGKFHISPERYTSFCLRRRYSDKGRLEEEIEAVLL